METIQIRLPKEIITRIDQLVKSGLFQNRSDIIRTIIRDYFIKSNYNGNLPYMVGPFTTQEIQKIQKTTIEDLRPDPKLIEEIKSQLKRIDLATIVDKL